MANPWFRFYAEFEDDPKVQMLSEEMQRRLALLFCERCKEEKRTDAERAFKWHISPGQLAETKALFLEKEFIDQKWNLLNWNKRQFVSDSSTERVRRFRKSGVNGSVKQDETLQVVSLKQSVTAPDTEADAETEQKQRVSDANASSPRRAADGAVNPLEEIYKRYPRKEGHRAAVKAIEKSAARLRKGEGELQPMSLLDARRFLFRRVQAYARSPAGLRADQALIPHPATWFNQSRYLDDESTWQTAGERNGKSLSGNTEALRQSLAEDQDGADGSGNLPWSEA